MKVFKDNSGREWTVAVTVEALRRVRDLKGIDLMDLSRPTSAANNIAEKLAGDPILLVDILWCVVKPQADERGVSDIQFGEAMFGDCLGEATRVLLEEIVNFTPDRRDRELLTESLKKLDGWLDQARERIRAAVNDPRVDELVQTQIETLGKSSTTLLDSLASTPTPEP